MKKKENFCTCNQKKRISILPFSIKQSQPSNSISAKTTKNNSTSNKKSDSLPSNKHLEKDNILKYLDYLEGKLASTEEKLSRILPKESLSASNRPHSTILYPEKTPKKREPKSQNTESKNRRSLPLQNLNRSASIDHYQQPQDQIASFPQIARSNSIANTTMPLSVGQTLSLPHPPSNFWTPERKKAKPDAQKPIPPPKDPLTKKINPHVSLKKPPRPHAKNQGQLKNSPSSLNSYSSTSTVSDVDESIRQKLLRQIERVENSRLDVGIHEIGGNCNQVSEIDAAELDYNKKFEVISRRTVSLSQPKADLNLVRSSSYQTHFYSSTPSETMPPQQKYHCNPRASFQRDSSHLTFRENSLQIKKSNKLATKSLDPGIYDHQQYQTAHKVKTNSMKNNNSNLGGIGRGFLPAGHGSTQGFPNLSQHNLPDFNNNPGRSLSMNQKSIYKNRKVTFNELAKIKVIPLEVRDPFPDEAMARLMQQTNGHEQDFDQVNKSGRSGGLTNRTSKSTEENNNLHDNHSSLIMREYLMQNRKANLNVLKKKQPRQKSNSLSQHASTNDKNQNQNKSLNFDADGVPRSGSLVSKSSVKEKVTSEDARNKDLLSRIKKRFRMNKSSK